MMHENRRLRISRKMRLMTTAMRRCEAPVNYFLACVSCSHVACISAQCDGERMLRVNTYKSKFWDVCEDHDEKIDGVQVSDALNDLLGRCRTTS